MWGSPEAGRWTTDEPPPLPVPRAVHDVTDYGAAATGIGTDAMVNSLVAGCVVTDCGRRFGAARDGPNLGSNGIGIGTGGADAEPVVVSACHARDNGNNGIVFENQTAGAPEEGHHAGHLVVDACTAVGNRVGFRTSADRRVRFADCSAHANAEAGVVIDEKDDMPDGEHESVAVIANQFNDNGAALSTEQLPATLRDNAGTRTESAGGTEAVGDGEATEFVVPHGLDAPPAVRNVWPGSAPARGFPVAGVDEHAILVAYSEAPPEDVDLAWGVEARV